MIIYYGDFKKYSECSCLENVFFVRFLIYFICHLSRQVQFACLVSKPVYWKMKKGIITHSNKQTTKMFATIFHTHYICAWMQEWMGKRLKGKGNKNANQHRKFYNSERCHDSSKSIKNNIQYSLFSCLSFNLWHFTWLIPPA